MADAAGRDLQGTQQSLPITLETGHHHPGRGYHGPVGGLHHRHRQRTCRSPRRRAALGWRCPDLRCCCPKHRASLQNEIGASRSPMVMPCAPPSLLQRRRGHGTTVASMNVLARPSADNDVHHVRARGCVAPRCDVGPARCNARRWGSRCSQADACLRPDRRMWNTVYGPTTPTALPCSVRPAAECERRHGFPPTWEVMRRRAGSELTPPGWISGAALEEAGCVS